MEPAWGPDPGHWWVSGLNGGFFLGTIRTQQCPGPLTTLLPCVKPHGSWCRRHKRHWFDPWVRKIPWRRKWQPTPLFLPGEFHGQRSLVGYSPWGHMGSIPGSGRSAGEGNGKPAQYSSLGNPMDRGAWQTTVHGVTKSQTQLK